MDHSNRAIEFALNLNVTPLLLVVHYSMYGIAHPPSFYKVFQGNAIPISRKESEFECLAKVIYLPNDVEVIWK